MPNKTTKTYSFRNMPEDVYKIIIREQNKLKEKKGTTQFSMELAIYHIIKEYDKRINPLPDTQAKSVSKI